MHKIAITGGPCCGKTTLIGELERRIPTAKFLEEAAGLVISLELEREKEEKGHTGLLPWNDMEAFQHRVIDLTLQMEKESGTGGLAFQDRGLLDNIAYARLSDLKSVETRAIEVAKTANYDLAIFCEPFPYEASAIRREDPQQATKIHEAILSAYREYGPPLLILPATSTTERADLIENLL